MTGPAGGRPLVGIVMGSDSDLATMDEAGRVLQEFGVAYEMTIASAHRSPARVEKYVSEAEARGIRVFIAGAGAGGPPAGVVGARAVLPGRGGPPGGSAPGGRGGLRST